MKKTILSAIAIMMLIILALPGCGNDNNNATPIFVTKILSNPALDGDILQTSPTTFTITQSNTQSVFAGIVPGTLPEYRAFLDFPLSTVPLDAGILSANLIIFIDSFQSTLSIPMRIELVSFSSLSGADFDSTPLVPTAIIFSVFQTDVNNFVSIDVTSLMKQAQSLPIPLSDFQIRILLDFSAVSGRIEINDTTDPTFRGDFAPLLRVEYF